MNSRPIGVACLTVFVASISGAQIQHDSAQQVWTLKSGVVEYRLQMQKGHLTKIRELFGNDVLAQIPEFERDITGLPMIEKMAEALFGPSC